MMKKVISIILVIICVSALAACAKDEEISVDDENKEFSEQTTQTNKTDKTDKTNNRYAHYFDNYLDSETPGELYVADTKEGTSMYIGEAGCIPSLIDGVWAPIILKDSSIVYIHDGKLKYKRLDDSNQENERVLNETGDIKWVKISKDENEIAFAVYNDNIYLHNIKENETRLLVEHTNINEYGADSTLKHIAFFDGYKDLYVVNTKGNVKKIDCNVDDIICVYNTGEMYYVKGSGATFTLVYFDGEESTIVSECWSRSDVLYMSKSWGIWSTQQPILVFTTNHQDNQWKIAIKENSYELPNISFSFAQAKINESFGVAITIDCEKMYYLDEDKLYCATITKHGISNVELYDTGINTCYLRVLEDGSIVYIKDEFLYVNGQQIQDAKVKYDIMEDKSSGDLYYLLDNGMLMCYGGEKEREVATDVDYMMITNQNVVLFWKGGNLYGYCDGVSHLIGSVADEPYYLVLEKEIGQNWE